MMRERAFLLAKACVLKDATMFGNVGEYRECAFLIEYTILCDFSLQNFVMAKLQKNLLSYVHMRLFGSKEKS